MYAYFYPWLYNKVNHVTKRGKDLDDDIDMVNVIIMAAGVFGALQALMALTERGIASRIKK